MKNLNELDKELKEIEDSKEVLVKPLSSFKREFKTRKIRINNSAFFIIAIASVLTNVIIITIPGTLSLKMVGLLLLNAFYFDLLHSFKYFNE